MIFTIIIRQNVLVAKPPNESNDQEKNIDDQKEEHFLALDSDGDKRITREELIQYLHKLEGMKDEKKRNKRDPDQILKEREELIEDIFKSKDSDKDGYLSMNELFEGETDLKEDEQDEIKAIDTNGDGKLSKEELSNYIEREHEETEEEDEKEDPAEAKEGYINQFFETQDLDKDGVITYEEFHANRDEL